MRRVRFAADLAAEGRRRADVHQKQAPALAAAAILIADDDPFAHLEHDLDSARIITPEEAALTPARLLAETMRPIARALERHRRARRNVEKAFGSYAKGRAAEKLRLLIATDPEVRAAIAMDRDTEEALLLPVIRAALDGSSTRWRVCRGRVIDEEGRGLEPMCLRPWQRLSI